MALKAHEPWPVVTSGLCLFGFMLFYLVPRLVDQYKLHRYIGGELVGPGYFRLVPYEAYQAGSFSRPDGAAADVRRWIEAAQAPVIYLYGQSGVGKTSLINAAVVPGLTGAGWVVVAVRPQDVPLDAARAALLRPSAIWQTPRDGGGPLRDLVERAAARVTKDGKRLLLAIDPFEEALVLCSEDGKAALAAWLRDMAERPVAGLKLLLSLRAEYVGDLPDLGLPHHACGFGQNAFEVRPFSRAEAQSFIERSGLTLAPALLEKTLGEAAEIEDMPDKVRPIVLNMLGVVVKSFKGVLPREVRPGHLLTGYVERCLKHQSIPAVAVRVLRPLVTAAGTKRAQRLETIAAPPPHG